MTEVDNYILGYINALNGSTQLDPLDVLAFCHVESACNPLAYRFEPRLNEASYGIMQVLLSTAKDRGFTGVPNDLFTVANGLRYGMATIVWTRDYLNEHLGREATQEEIVAAYNEGVGNVVRNVPDASYVDKWKAVRAGLNG